MPNDAISVAVDQITFKGQKSRKMRVYAIAVVADNLGKIVVTEPHSARRIRHKPKKGLNAVWDFAGDGFDVYHRMGGLPDLIKGEFMVVRDHSGTRKVGEIIKGISADAQAKGIIDEAAKNVPFAGPSGVIGAAVGIIGSLLANKKDTIIESVQGSFALTPERREKNGLEDLVAGNEMDFEIDVMLWDGVAEQDGTADTRAAQMGLEASGLVWSNQSSGGS